MSLVANTGLSYERALYNKRVGFFFGTVLYAWNDVVLWEQDHGGDGQYYRYIGATALPVTISPGSTPNSTDWENVGDASGTPHMVNSIANLYKRYGQDGVVFAMTAGYHPDGVGYGAGVYMWKPTEPRSNHDGIFVIDPTKKYPASWNDRAQRVAWYTAQAGSALGCWVATSMYGWVDAAGAKPYDAATVDTEAFKYLEAALVQLYELPTIRMGAGTYRAHIEPLGMLYGNGYDTDIRPDLGTSPIIIEMTQASQTTIGAGWLWREMRDFVLNGEDSARSTVTLISYDHNITPESAVLGRWKFVNIVLTNANVGIRKPNGNIGNYYEGISTQFLNYGLWATARSTAPVMHEGNDTFVKCHWNKCYKACYRSDVTVYGSSLDTRFQQNVWEYNDGFGILLRGSQSNQLNVGALGIDGGHFEGNGTVGSLVDIDGVMMQPVDFYAQFIRHISIKDVLMGSITLVTSSVAADGCCFSDIRGASYTYFSVDNNSSVVCTNDRSQFAVPLDGFVINTKAVPHNSPRGGVTAAHRSTRANVSISSPNGFSKNFDGSSPIQSATGSLYTSTQVQDAMLGQYSARWDIPAGTTVVLTHPDSMTMTNGRYYVWSVAARWVGGSASTYASLQVAQAGGATLSQPLTKGRENFWKTFADIGIYGTTGDNRVALRVNNDGVGGNTLVQTADFQIMQFQNLIEALAWFNSGQCLGRL